MGEVQNFWSIVAFFTELALSDTVECSFGVVNVLVKAFVAVGFDLGERVPVLASTAASAGDLLVSRQLH